MSNINDGRIYEPEYISICSMNSKELLHEAMTNYPNYRIISVCIEPRISPTYGDTRFYAFMELKP